MNCIHSPPGLVAPSLLLRSSAKSHQTLHERGGISTRRSRRPCWKTLLSRPRGLSKWERLMVSGSRRHPLGHSNAGQLVEACCATYSSNPHVGPSVRPSFPILHSVSYAAVLTERMVVRTLIYYMPRDGGAYRRKTSGLAPKPDWPTYILLLMTVLL